LPAGESRRIVKWLAAAVFVEKTGGGRWLARTIGVVALVLAVLVIFRAGTGARNRSQHGTRHIGGMQ